MTGRRDSVERKAGAIRPGRILLALLAIGVALLALASTAGATQYQRPLLGAFGSVEQPSFASPETITVDQATGEVLVGDSGAIERQKVAVNATAGTFRLKLEGKTTEDIPFDANFSTVRQALETTIGSSVGGQGSGEHYESSPFEFSFGERNLEQLSCEDGEPPLSGGSGCSVTTIEDGKQNGVYRYHSDGTPAPFNVLGSVVIDGKAGPGGKPCAEEPASCDQTPQNGLKFGQAGISQPAQIAVDPTNGNIYLTQYEYNLIDIFSSEGKYLGQLTAVGTTKFTKPCGVVVSSVGAVYVSESNLRIAKFVSSDDNPPVNADGTVVIPKGGFESTCQMALGSGPSAGSIFINNNSGSHPGSRTLKVNSETGEFSEFANGYDRLVAVDPTSGNPIVGAGRKTVKEEEQGESVGGTYELFEFDGSLESTEAVLSKLVAGASIRDFATDASGEVYVITGRRSQIHVYGSTPAAVPTVAVGPPSEVTSSTARLSGTVNPEDIDVEECFFEWGRNGELSHKVSCEESIPTNSSDTEVHATITGLEPNGVKYSFRLAAMNENGTEYSSVEGFMSASTVVTKVATVTGSDTAELNGEVRPEGSQYTECFFEWGPTTTFGYEHTAPCHPEAGEIPDDSGVYQVSAPLSGLQEATTYRFRLQATNGEGTVIGAEETFETWGAPQITTLRAGDASANAATIEAEIDPSGFDTSYWFEWGPTPSYGHLTPIDPEAIGDGEEPVHVHADLSNLDAGTAYHYRVVAESRHEMTASDDQIVETLNSCGLLEGRCFELVSRRDPGPIARPGEGGPAIDLHYQAATAGPGALAYPVESGYPDATKGHVGLYRATRGSDGWNSTQISTPIVGRNETNGIGSLSGNTKWLSDDLSCGFGESKFALTDDPGPQLLYKAGLGVLYRLDAGGGYTAVPSFAPEQLPASSGGYEVLGASQDCRKVIFSTSLQYPRVPNTGSKSLYEWEDGTLRNVGFVPGPSGEVLVPATGGAFNAVSRDGSRVFFTATRQTSPDPKEIGAPGVFVRENGTTTRDLSLSETSTPDNGAHFQYATADGSKVFFTANAGLTAESSPVGEGIPVSTDLYEYDLETDTLTDLSPLDAPGGAEVTGFVGASEDGSYVYFIARGQFLAGYGKTFAQNVSDKTHSLYGVHDGEVSFVGTIGGEGNALLTLIQPGQRSWSSVVSPDGRYLLFQTEVDNTSYHSGGVAEAYLYDAHSKGLVCISCRPDGQPSIAPTTYKVLAAGEATNNELHEVQFLTEGENGPEAFFSSPDVLAPGAVEGQNNIYEWSHGQISRLAGQARGVQAHPVAGYVAAFVGASTNGSDVYLSTPEALNWEDPDERISIYDARIDGGFPEPAAPAAPCEAVTEGSCQRPSQGAATAPGVATGNFSGPGNSRPSNNTKKSKKKKHSKKKHKQHSKKKSKQKKNKKKNKSAGADRRAGK
ncbi:MAG TPA: hypothetical protein VHU86_04340 [Solirubrobacterales bacterium]|nr:hypothetical protein [Solirubrobacterales bacterium]